MMKVFNRIARVVAVLCLLVVIFAAWARVGWMGAAAAIGAAAAVFMLWCACPPEEHRGEAKLQIEVINGDDCRVHMKADLEELELYIPAAIACLCKSANIATKGKINPVNAVGSALEILREEHDMVRIGETKEVKI